MCIYGENLACLNGRATDALPSLVVAADGLATIRGAMNLDIHCNMNLAI